MGSWTGTPRAHGNLNERAESKARSVERRARDGLASPTQVLLPLGSGPSLYDVTSTILPRPPSLSFALFFSLAPSPPLSFFPSFSISVPAPSFSRPPVFLLLRSFLRPAATRPAFSVSLLRSLLLSSLLIHAVTLFLLSLPPLSLSLFLLLFLPLPLRLPLFLCPPLILLPLIPTLFQRPFSRSFRPYPRIALLSELPVAQCTEPD